jgi:hypothetical protein
MPATPPPGSPLPAGSGDRPRLAPAGTGPRCPRRGPVPASTHPIRTGRERGCWPSRGSRGDPRPGFGVCGPRCPRRGPGLVVLTQSGQVASEAVGRAEGVGVILAQDLASAGQRVLVEGPGPLVVAQRGQGLSHHAGCLQCVRVVDPCAAPVTLVDPFPQPQRGRDCPCRWRYHPALSSR